MGLGQAGPRRLPQQGPSRRCGLWVGGEVVACFRACAPRCLPASRSRADFSGLMERDLAFCCFPGVEIICYNQAASAKAWLAVPLGPWDSVLSGGGVCFSFSSSFSFNPLFPGILQGLCVCLWMPAPLAVDENSVAFSDSPVLRSFSVLRRAVSAAGSAGSPGF